MKIIRHYKMCNNSYVQCLMMTDGPQALCSHGSVGGFMFAKPPYRYATDKVYYRDVHNIIILLFQTRVFTCEAANLLL